MKNLFYLFIAFCFLTLSCSDEQDITNSEDTILVEDIIIDEENSYLSTLNTSDNRSIESTGNYIYSLALKKGSKLPDGFFLKGIELKDDGLMYDKVAGDGIYTTNLPFNIKKSDAAKTNWYIKFKANIVGPGQDCMGNKCPKRTTIFGTGIGESNTWFCICTGELDICLGSDC